MGVSLPARNRAWRPRAATPHVPARGPAADRQAGRPAPGRCAPTAAYTSPEEPAGQRRVEGREGRGAGGGLAAPAVPPVRRSGGGAGGARGATLGPSARQGSGTRS